VTITNDTAATIELDSAVITLRNARADTLIPLGQWVCGSTGDGSHRLAPLATCQVDAIFRVDPGWRNGLRANPRLRAIAIVLDVRVDGVPVRLSLPLERTYQPPSS
jgi:hypothetical protein